MSGQTVVLSGCVWTGNKLLELNRASCLDRQFWGCAWAGTARPRLLLLLLPLAELACPGISTTNGYHPLPSGHCCLSRHYPVLPSQALWLPNVVAQVHVCFNSSSAKSIRPFRIKMVCQSQLAAHFQRHLPGRRSFVATPHDNMCRLALLEWNNMWHHVSFSFFQKNTWRHVSPGLSPQRIMWHHMLLLVFPQIVTWRVLLCHMTSCDGQ